MRYILRNAAGGELRIISSDARCVETHSWLLHRSEEIIIYGNKENEKDKEKFMDKSTGQEMEQAAEAQSLLEWFAERYRDFGAKLEVRTFHIPHTFQPIHEAALTPLLPHHLVRHQPQSRRFPIRQRLWWHRRHPALQSRPVQLGRR